MPLHPSSARIPPSSRGGRLSVVVVGLAVVRGQRLLYVVACTLLNALTYRREYSKNNSVMMQGLHFLFSHAAVLYMYFEVYFEVFRPVILVNRVQTNLDFRFGTRPGIALLWHTPGKMLQVCTSKYMYGGTWLLVGASFTEIGTSSPRL